MNKELFDFTLHLADNSLVLAQRLSEWTGHGPFLEEDLALTNIALDIFGRANSLLEYAAKLEGKGRTQDDLAFFRNEREFTNCLMCELPKGDYAFTILRQAFMDSHDYLVYSKLVKSKDETLAGIAAKSLKEITYHKRHSFSWVVRFGNGTDESKKRLHAALSELYRFTGELFESTEGDKKLSYENIGLDFAEIKADWEKEIKELFEKAVLSIPEETFMQTGGRKGVHTEHLGYMLSEMQSLPRMLPDAKW
ncbi:MAG: 1,2-phenylacetyl-CoA epoxidase subunit PaaC [Bacteroidia bacterium]